MSVIEYIVFSIAIGIEAFVVMSDSANVCRVRLSKGLVGAVAVSIVDGLLFFIGAFVGDMVRFSPVSPDPDTASTNAMWAHTDSLVYLGLLVFIALRLVFGAYGKRRARAFDLSSIVSYILIALIFGVNVLIAGIAVGFRGVDVHRSAVGGITLSVVFFLMVMFGIMFGRQHVEFRGRRWLLIAALIVLAFALKGVLWG